MTVDEANNKIEEFYEILSPTKEQINDHIEELKFLASKNDLFGMREFGNAMAYYGRYDIAEKYYNMVIESDKNPNKELSHSTFAHIELGDLYLKDYIGKKNYDKAYQHYKMAAFYGNVLAKERIADMYKEGIYVKKDYARYVKIITELYEKYKDNYGVDISLSLKMAKIRYDLGDCEGCKEIVRIFELGGGFGGINIFSIENDIKDIIEIQKLQYKLGMINESEFDIFSLDSLNSIYKKFSFKYRNKRYEVRYNELGYYEFENTKYKSLTDLILKARIQDKAILEILDKIINYKTYK